MKFIAILIILTLLLLTGCEESEKNVQPENNITTNDTKIDSTINNKKITEQIQELSEDHRWIINAMLHEAKRIENDYQKDRLNAWINNNPQSILSDNDLKSKKHSGIKLEYNEDGNEIIKLSKYENGSSILTIAYERANPMNRLPMWADVSYREATEKEKFKKNYRWKTQNILATGEREHWVGRSQWFGNEFAYDIEFSMSDGKIAIRNVEISNAAGRRKTQKIVDIVWSGDEDAELTKTYFKEGLIQREEKYLDGTNKYIKHFTYDENLNKTVRCEGECV